MTTLKLKHSPALVTLQRPTHPAFTAAMWQQSRERRGMRLQFTATPREQSVIVWALGRITAALR